MRSAVLTQWFDNGDGILDCSVNGGRLDHPEAHLVVLRLLLTESGHYILPVNNKQKDVELNNAEKSRIKSMLCKDFNPANRQHWSSLEIPIEL